MTVAYGGSARHAGSQRGESGFTLIELLITMVLGVLVLSIVGGIIISVATTQNSVSQSTAATLAGQLVSSSLQKDIRASQVSALATGTATAADPTFQLTTVAPADQLLVALVVTAGAAVGSHCVGWYYSAADRTISFISSATAITAPTPSSAHRWSILASGVSPINGTAVFSTIPHAALPSSLAGDFTVDTATAAAIAFHVVALSRTGLFESSQSCY